MSKTFILIFLQYWSSFVQLKQNIPRNVIILQETRVQLNCSNSTHGSVGPVWIFKPAAPPGEDRTIFNGYSVSALSESNFGVETSNPGNFHLTIKTVRLEDAGTYQCQTVSDGIYQTEVVVLESAPQCNFNSQFTSSDTDNFQMWCQVAFKGRLNPSMRWTLDQGQDFTNNSMINRTDSKDSPNTFDKYTYFLDIPFNSTPNGSLFTFSFYIGRPEDYNFDWTSPQVFVFDSTDNDRGESFETSSSVRPTEYSEPNRMPLRDTTQKSDTTTIIIVISMAAILGFVVVLVMTVAIVLIVCYVNRKKSEEKTSTSKKERREPPAPRTKIPEYYNNQGKPQPRIPQSPYDYDDYEKIDETEMIATLPRSNNNNRPLTSQSDDLTSLHSKVYSVYSQHSYNRVQNEDQQSNSASVVQKTSEESGSQGTTDFMTCEKTKGKYTSLEEFVRTGSPLAGSYTKIDDFGDKGQSPSKKNESDLEVISSSSESSRGTNHAIKY